jgi:hypothetical protein
LHDTKSKAEEFVIIGDCVDVGLCEYKISTVSGEYDVQSSVLIPAFRVAEGVYEIPLKRGYGAIAFRDV